MDVHVVEIRQREVKGREVDRNRKDNEMTPT